jgi:peptidoglycan L-alanyl-D-glutamate endopeptidase CwlK
VRFVLGERSLARLATCDPALAAVVTRAIEITPFDFTVVCGHRGEAEQNQAYAEKKSKLRWPQSKHNASPARAVDLAPFIDGEIPWNDRASFHVLAGVVFAAAKERGVAIRWGGNWGPSWAPTLNKFPDLPHYELL